MSVRVQFPPQVQKYPADKAGFFVPNVSKDIPASGTKKGAFFRLLFLFYKKMIISFSIRKNKRHRLLHRCRISIFCRQQ